MIRTLITSIFSIFLFCLLTTSQVLATDYAYGYTSLTINVGAGTVSGYHRTEIDYNTEVYYTPYVCGSLYQNDVEIQRVCYGGIASATRTTQMSYTAGAKYAALSDHYVDIIYYEETSPILYEDYLGYGFLPGYAYPTSYGFAAPGTYTTTYSVSVYLGNTYVQLPKVDKIQFNYNGTWTDVPSGGIVDICPGSAIAFKAVIAPAGATWPTGQPSWGGDASGTGGEKTVTFSSSGSRSVTASAFSGNQETAAITVGSANSTVSITWPSATVNYYTATLNPNAVPSAFTISYSACADIANDAWRLRISSISGGATLNIYTGGYRNPTTSPPVNQTEAADAVTVMKNYYTNGRGTWHTADASLAHEQHHYSEWQCSSDHYWPATESALENLTVAYHSYANAAAAITAIKAMTNGANTKMTNFNSIAASYYGTLSDAVGSRPYAAGQLTLNSAIIAVQNLAAANGWTVPSGVNTPSATPACYQSWLPYSP